MNLIDNLTDDANQITRIGLPDGSEVTINLIYRAAVERWTLDVFWNDFVAYNINICAYPNLVRPWRETLPFGFACITSDGVDPVYINDFIPDGRAQLFLLNEDEVSLVEASILGTAS